MEKRGKKEFDQDGLEHLEFEPLQDEDLKSIAGGCSMESNVSNACCSGEGGGYDH